MKRLIAVLLFAVSAQATFANSASSIKSAKNIPAAAGPLDKEVEDGSALTFRTVMKSAEWCASKSALAAVPASPKGLTWGQVSAEDYTVYIDDKLVDKKLIRISAREVTVCIPKNRNYHVLIFGPDSRGSAAQYSSEDAAAE